MSRYINMDDVITYPVMPKEYRKYQTMNLDDAYEQGWNDLQTLIEKMPIADVRKNVHGHWKFPYETTMMICYCSECGKSANPKYKFCPNCGADMRGEKDE